MKGYEGKMFRVSDEESWTIVDSLNDAFKIYNIFKSFGLNVSITDAVTDKVIKK